ncbi:MAG: hypothetical protein H0U52_01715 [Chloroflexi bacterium]|nr:hypothetical protein [Chloroflexota bacterium]
MDGSFLQPLGLGALVVAMIVTLYEMNSALGPERCPECSHCLAIAAEESRTQERLSREYARRAGLEDEDDDRGIG